MNVSRISEEEKTMTVPFTVRSYESDASRRATIQTICNYFQEMAWLHATRLGFALADQENSTKAWVLLELHVQMDRYPVWGDTITVSTWPSGKNRLYAYRDFEIRNNRDEIIGTATSAWIIIDIQKRRPQRMPDELDLCVPKNKTVPFHEALFSPKIDLPAHVDAEAGFQVRLSDIDVNNHVNNVNFIEWAIEAAPSAWRSANQLAEIHVEFKAESNYGEHIVSQFTGIHPSENGLHRVFRPADSKTLMLARTVWKPCT